ncbi:hypothetical protein U1Q18_045297 [Sarracenia purpurea var. burkii]
MDSGAICRMLRKKRHSTHSMRAFAACSTFVKVCVRYTRVEERAESCAGVDEAVALSKQVTESSLQRKITYTGYRRDEIKNESKAEYSRAEDYTYAIGG